MPINKILGIRPEPMLVFLRPKNELRIAIDGFRVFLHEAHKEPTKSKQLFAGNPHFIGIIDAAKEGTWGVVIGEGDVCVTTVVRYKWPKDIQDMVCTYENPKGPITNLDLELAGLLICWLVMEEVAPCLYH